MGPIIKAPFPWTGGKSGAASLIWERFGDVHNYVEPFAGSLAVPLSRPNPPPGLETLNDADGLLVNFWRATVADPEAVARHCDWPCSEADLHPRHAHLVARRDEISERLMGDPEFYDAKLAGWWVWGAALAMDRWCAGYDPWRIVEGRLVKAGRPGISRALPQACRMGVHGKTFDPRTFSEIRSRLKKARILCGDWRRPLGSGVKQGGDAGGAKNDKLTAVLLDPPYIEGEYKYSQGSAGVALSVEQWCASNGDDRLLRIALCGYPGDYPLLEEWDVKEVTTRGSKSSTAKPEAIWFSPACLDGRQGKLFG